MNDRVQPGPDSSVDVVVVGGGLGGLLIAIELRRRGLDPLVLEAQAGPGGVARTTKEAGYLLEPAASSFLLPHPHLSRLFEAAGVTVIPGLAAARRRFLYDGGRMIEVAPSLALALSPVLSARAKLRLLAEPIVRRRPAVTRTGTPAAQDESLAVFLRRRFGRDAGTLLATVMAHGVFAGDPERTSARAAFPALVALEDEAGSVVRGAIGRMRARPKGRTRPTLHVAPGGMVVVAETMATSLGDRFRSDARVESIERCHDRWVVRIEGATAPMSAPALVLALAPHAAAPLLPESVSSLLGRARVTPVAVVGLGGRAADVPLPNGFGVLTGPHAGVRALGVLFESQYAPERAPAGHRLAKAIYGGAADPSVMKHDDDTLISLAREEVGRIIGVPVQPTWTTIVRHEPGIPQFGLGHTAWLAALDEVLLDLPGLHLGGWAYRGVGLSSLATDAVRLAEVITTSR